MSHAFYSMRHFFIYSKRINENFNYKLISNKLMNLEIS